MNYFLNEYDPEPYRFCACCEKYRPERLLHRLSARDLPVKCINKLLS
jgi:hypothetical protein